MKIFGDLVITDEQIEQSDSMRIYAKLYFQGKSAKAFEPTCFNTMSLGFIYQKIFQTEALFSSDYCPERNKIIFGVSTHEEAVELLQMEHLKLFELFRAFFPIPNLKFLIQVNP